jgi:peptidoglycan/xylan/chitin deacetylase (PgdA/CDA1 family)
LSYLGISTSSGRRWIGDAPRLRMARLWRWNKRRDHERCMRAVLTYHSIDDSRSAISVSPDAFERHVRWLASGRVRVVPLDELAARPPDEDAVALTFDDAFENFGTRAAPRLAAHGLPVTLFVVTGCVGGTNDWHGRPAPGIPTLPLLDWPALERLAAAGTSLGAHSRTHPDLTRLDAASLDDEIFGSAESLRTRLGHAPRAFAYPYGRFNATVAARVSSCFAWACTTDLRPFEREEDPAQLPRLDMYYFQAPGQLEAWNSPSFRGRLGVRRGLRRLRSALTQRQCA